MLIMPPTVIGQPIIELLNGFLLVMLQNLIKLSDNDIESLARQMRLKVEKMQSVNTADLKLASKKLRVDQVNIKTLFLSNL